VRHWYNAYPIPATRYSSIRRISLAPSHFQVFGPLEQSPQQAPFRFTTDRSYALGKTTLRSLHPTTSSNSPYALSSSSLFSMSFFSRRRSKSERDRHSLPPISNPSMPQSPPSSYNATMLANGVTGAHHDSRPGSSAMSDASYDFAQHGQGQPQPSNHGAATANNPIANPTNTSHRYANAAPSANSQPHALTHSSRPISSTLPNTTSSGLGNLSRTDQVVLQYFWHAKAEENAQRDLHFLKFPIFGNSPGMRELIPFCEIYSLVKSSQGAKVVGLGTLGSSMGGSGHAGGGTFIG
jgi:hypothetical protein